MIKTADCKVVGSVEKSSDNKAPEIKCGKCQNKYPVYLDDCPYCKDK